MPYLDLPDGIIEYRIIDGDTTREPLVFLHEGLGCIAMWSRFPDLVAHATGRAAAVYSRYGYGGSAPLSAPRSANYLHEEADRVLPELLDRLSVQRPILIGHSDGASIALLYASARPTAGLVAIAPHVFVEPETLRGISAAKSQFSGGELARRLARFHNHPDTVFHSWADVWLSPEFAHWNIEYSLPNIRSPVLLIQGECDQYGTSSQLDAIAVGVDRPTRRLEIPGCGHSPHLEYPELTQQAATTFVGTLPTHEPRPTTQPSQTR